MWRTVSHRDLEVDQKMKKKSGGKDTMKEGEWIHGREFHEMQSLRSQLMRSRDQCGNTLESIEGKQQM